MVKDATKVRLLTGAGLIDAKVVQVDAANDLALLKADAHGSRRSNRAFAPARTNRRVSTTRADHGHLFLLHANLGKTGRRDGARHPLSSTA